jgi:hypothetical protein
LFTSTILRQTFNSAHNQSYEIPTIVAIHWRNVTTKHSCWSQGIAVIWFFYFQICPDLSMTVPSQPSDHHFFYIFRIPISYVIPPFRKKRP